MKEKLKVYYTEHFDSVCKKDKVAASYLKSTLLQNGINLDKECDSGGHLLDDYYSRRDYEGNDLLIILSIFMIIILITLYKKRKQEGVKEIYKEIKKIYFNSRKFIFFSFIMSVLVLGLLIYDFNTCDRFNTLDNGECCLDNNEDGICDKHTQLKECLIGSDQDKLSLGRRCDDSNDCLEYATLLQVPEIYLEQGYFECQKTSYIIMPEFIPCLNKQDCLDSIESLIDVSDVVQCGGRGFCEMTSLSSVSLRSTYRYNINRSL